MTQRQPEKQKLKVKFDPIWLDDHAQIKEIGAIPFLVRQIIRLARDPYTNISNITDTEIHHLTGLNRWTIREARKKLVSAGKLIPNGYHSYTIETWIETVQPNQNQLDRNCPTLGQKLSNHLDRNCPTLGQKLSNPYIQNQTNTDTDREKLSFDNEKHYPKNEEINTFKMLYHWKDREMLKRQLLMRNLNEAEIGKVFEQTYPQQYTGKSV